MRMHHVGVAVSSIDLALTVYQDIFGYELQSGPFHDPLQRVNVCFVGRADPEPALIELVEPAAGDSPLSRYLSKGIGTYHLCYETSDLEGTLSHVRSKRCVILTSPAPAVAFNGRRIAWFYTPTQQLIELLEE